MKRKTQKNINFPVCTVRSIIYFLTVVFISNLIVGCGAGDILDNVKSRGVVTGKLIDVTTRKPIPNAEISLNINGDNRSATSKSNIDAETNGDFKFTSVPSGSFQMTIRVDGWAKAEYLVLVEESHDNTTIITALGNIPLAKAFDLTTYLTINGEPTQGVPVYVEATGVSNDCEIIYGDQLIKNSWFSLPPKYLFINDNDYSESDENGKAIFTGLDQCLNYMVVAPPYDQDGDNVPDFATETETYEGALSNLPNVSLALREIEFNEEIEIVGSSLDTNTSVAFQAYKYSNFMEAVQITGAGSFDIDGRFKTKIASMGSKDPIKLVLNPPIAELQEGSLSLTYINDLISSDANNDDSIDDGYGTKIIIPANFELNDMGTILTVTSEGDLPMNETISIQGTALTRDELYSKNIRFDIYVERSSESSLSEKNIAIDNYNGIPEYTWLEFGHGYLEFPEYVTGKYRVISVLNNHTDITLKSTIDSSWIPISPMDSSISSYDPGYELSVPGTISYTEEESCNRCGKGTGVTYRVPLYSKLRDRYSVYSIGDDINVRDGDIVVVDVDVEDIKGNRVSKTLTLTVQ